MTLIKQLLVISTLFCTSLCKAETTQQTISFSYSTTEISTGNEKPEIVFDAAASDQASDRWITTDMFADYWHYQDTAAMIDGAYSSASTLIQQILDVFENATKDRSLSNEEQSNLYAKLTAEMLGFKNLDHMQKSFLSSMALEVGNSKYDEAVDEELCSEDNTPQHPVTTLANTATGREIIELLDLYHVILYRLASRAATSSTSAMKVFQTLEAEIFSILEEKTNSHAENDDTSAEISIEKARQQIMEALTAIHEFLHKKLRAICTEPLFVAAAIAKNQPERDADNLTYLDFKIWADNKILLENEALLDQDDGGEFIPTPDLWAQYYQAPSATNE